MSAEASAVSVENLTKVFKGAIGRRPFTAVRSSMLPGILFVVLFFVLVVRGIFVLRRFFGVLMKARTHCFRRP